MRNLLLLSSFVVAAAPCGLAQSVEMKSYPLPAGSPRNFYAVDRVVLATSVSSGCDQKTHQWQFTNQEWLALPHCTQTPWIPDERGRLAALHRAADGSARILIVETGQPVRDIVLAEQASELNYDAGLGRYVAYGNGEARIDAATGEVNVLRYPSIVDFGGLNTLVASPQPDADGRMWVGVADSWNSPTRSALGIVDPSGGAAEIFPLPDGWTLEGQLQFSPRLNGPRRGTRRYFDPVRNRWYLIAYHRPSNRSGIVVADFTSKRIQVSEFPTGWFSSCSRADPFSERRLRKLVFWGVMNSDIARAGCDAQGVVTLDLDSDKLGAIRFPSGGRVSLDSGSGMFGRYIYASNGFGALGGPIGFFPSVLFSIDLESGEQAEYELFSQPTQVEPFDWNVFRHPERNVLLAAPFSSRGRLAWFDLDEKTARTLTVDASQQRGMQPLAVLRPSGRLIVSGHSTDEAAARLFLYDPSTGVTAELPVVPGFFSAFANGTGGSIIAIIAADRQNNFSMLLIEEK